MKAEKHRSKLAFEHEEHQALLQNGDGSKPHDEEDQYDRPTPPHRKRALACVAVFFSFLLLAAVLPLHRLVSTVTADEDPEPESAPDSLLFSADGLRSNGTHEFRKSTLIVSIDGLRADYLDRGLTPHLLQISKKGIRAKSMRPIFPTLTFPNHWALMTGLYAESHGIIANNFWDPATGKEFHYNRADIAYNASWWSGEPMWETANRAGLITANLMWPGPAETNTGSSPTYFVPWKNKVPLSEKLRQILEWIDLPLERRPQLITAYEPSLDQAGHLTGPNSPLVNKILKTVDLFAKDLQAALAARNLTDIFDVVFVSDHGMTDTSNPELIYIDDILGEGFKLIEHEDGWPSMGLRFASNADERKYLNMLYNASQLSNGKFDVYTHDTMPERYHFVNNKRIAPIYVVPRVGYALTNHFENGEGMSKGNHGYDNNHPSMHAMFVAHGPFAAVVKAIEQSRQKQQQHGRPRRGLARPNKGWHSTSDDTYVMDTFDNVEIYNLMMKLLGIETHAASTNGTVGFWDKFF